MVNILICRATQYMPTVKALSKDHWVAIFEEISSILADNKPAKRKWSRSASSHGSEVPKEEEAAQEYILVSDDDE